MTEIRPIREEELGEASRVCLRSKAYWGYDDAFMAACVSELTLTKKDIEKDAVVIATDEKVIAGVAQVSHGEAGCFLEKLFVDPPRMGKGVGRELFHWAVGHAEALGPPEMIVEADPDAVPFYERMGCVKAGTAPSGSIAGRQLPRLIRKLHHE